MLQSSDVATPRVVSLSRRRVFRVFRASLRRAQSFVPERMGRRVPWGPAWCLRHLWTELRKNVLERTGLPFEDPFEAAAAAGGAFQGDKASLIDDW